MVVQEFVALSENSQKDILRTRAAYLASRKERHLVYFLYQLEDFYIEISLHCRTNKTGPIRCFQSMQLLDNYLAHMRVKHIS